DTITSLEGMLSLAFIHELYPAFQYIEHLKVAEMLMQTGGVQVMRAGIFLDADDMGSKLPMRGLFNAEVAVFHKAAQTCLVHCILGQAGAKQLFRFARSHDFLPCALGTAHTLCLTTSLRTRLW